MLLVTGEVERILERPAGRPGGQQWTEHTLVVRDWGQTLYVVAAKELVDAGLPAEGERVALEVSVRSYVKKDQTAKPSYEHSASHGLTAFRRNAEAETAMYPPLKAAANS